MISRQGDHHRHRTVHSREASSPYGLSTRSIFCFASATASDFLGAKVHSVDREMSGKSARVV